MKKLTYSIRFLSFLCITSILSIAISCTNNTPLKESDKNGLKETARTEVLKISSKKIANEGYDVVAYHTNNRAVEGTYQIAATMDDVYYHFSSVENKKIFEQNPKKYLPKYDGYCAIGVAWDSEKYDIDPEAFLIDNEELYLFCPGKLDDWIAKKDSLKQKADKNWAKMITTTK